MKLLAILWGGTCVVSTIILGFAAPQYEAIPGLAFMGVLGVLIAACVVLLPPWHSLLVERPLRVIARRPRPDQPLPDWERDLLLDPRWEWRLVQSLGMPCLHTEVVPVESVTGEVAARLCRTCDTQFPA